MVEVVPPTKRACELCGREEVWDEEKGIWVTEAEDDDPERGQPHCLHDWDINGTYNPIVE